MSYKLLSLLDIDIWNGYLNKLSVENKDVYFKPEYYALYEANGDGQAYCFVFEDGVNIALYPFLKNSVNQLEFKLKEEYYDIQGAYGYNGVLTNCKEDSFKSNFFKNFNNFCEKENIIAEFTRFHPLINNHSFSDQNMMVLKDRKTVFLDLTENNEKIWKKSYSSNNRNMIRKALKNNVEIIDRNKKEDYLEFYRIYIETMKNVNSDEYLFFNEQYFFDFAENLSKNHKLILAKYNDEIIGGMLLMYDKNYAHYHLSCRKSEYGRYALNNLFLDYAIKKAQKLGCKLFHLGGGVSSDEKDSLLKFKSNFSKDKADFYIGKKIHNTEVYKDVVRQWELIKPLSFIKNKKMILGYREV